MFIGAVFLDPIEMKSDNKRKQPTELLMVVCNALKDWRVIFLMPINIFTGLEGGFIFADFTEVSND